MGTHSIVLIRERKPKRRETSLLGGPAGSKYFYEYYVCVYLHFDGYVEGGVGEWLANFLRKFGQDCSTQNDSMIQTYADTGLLGAKLINAFYSSSKLIMNPRLVPIESLENMFQVDHEYAYIITTSYDENVGINDKSIMLSVCDNKDFILTARPEKFVEKYSYYMEQMEKNKKSFAEINYDDEVEKDGYLSEDQLLIEFLKTH
ncbi:unnamed protein product [Rhizophagus irregularis]|uniref:Uncharacterized protein n=1 Tax=Rhizophagus irregularis TaxID=588596 RepID=A0A2I1GEA6_9GLOM|nr:hypothetical protein RhiirA4_400515 [Rhizophagus irregularis]CAB4442784.1 unnamed protein product [Rhizophagus irregularis]